MGYVRKELWLSKPVIKALEAKASKVKVNGRRCSLKRYMELVVVNDSKMKRVIHK